MNVETVRFGLIGDNIARSQAFGLLSLGLEALTLVERDLPKAEALAVALRATRRRDGECEVNRSYLLTSCSA